MRANLRAVSLLAQLCAASALRPAPPIVRRPLPALRPTARMQRADDNDDPEGLSGTAVAALRWYKREISPLFPPGCRYIPTCSEYAIQSFKEFSVPQATVLTAWRLVRCNPLHLKGLGYGVDEPCWPPPAYWAGSGRVRTVLDDEQSRRKALGLDDAEGAGPRFTGGLPEELTGSRRGAEDLGGGSGT